jgi:chemotaxis protein methyltransferase CheR
MTGGTDLTWLEELIESHYGFAPTADLRQRLSSVWLHAQEREKNARGERLRRVVETIVIGESYFFRERGQIDYFVRKWAHEGSHEGLAPKPLRILSAGCSSGEEAYSLAIALDTANKAAARNVSIVGIDVSAAAIRKANKASYSSWALRSIPESERELYFRKMGDEYQLDERFRDRVRFEERNLFEVDGEFWAYGAFDAIFCRNVAIYFSPRAIRDLAARFAYVLAPGGYLFLGHSETLRGISNDFDIVHDGAVFYYLRKGGTATIPSSMSASAIVDDNAWPTPIVIAVPTIEHSPARITPSFDLMPTPLIASPEDRKFDVIRQRILDLIEVERFDEAWGLLSQLPRGAHTLRLLAAISIAKGLFEEAERACHELISLGEYEADAHCLLGSCREHQRAFDSAVRHYREAADLDPRFAMPCLRLGFLLERSGDSARGHIELARAVERMEVEHPDRVVLFGGGFSRKVLLDVCKEHLAAPVTRV